MSYQRFNKGGRVAKSPFLEKSVQKLLNKKTDLSQKSAFNATQKRTVYELSAIQIRWLGSKKSVFGKKVCKHCLIKRNKTDFLPLKYLFWIADYS